MTFYLHRNRIERQMMLYMAYSLVTVSRDERHKLIGEIENLKNRIIHIDQMTVTEAHEDVILYLDVRESKLNFIEE